MSEKKAFRNIKACVFDSYGTLFDVHSAVEKHRPRLGEAADRVSCMWRTKQLEYTWLRSLMDHYADFWQVTRDALDFSFDMHGITDPALARDLMQAYLKLDCYPDVLPALSSLKNRGLRLAILSNGTPAMLEAAVRHARIGKLIEETFSADAVGVFKPHPRVYRMAVDGLNLYPEEILFQSSNAWDASGAAAFGFNVAWINRFGQSEERLPGRPKVELDDLRQLPDLID